MADLLGPGPFRRRPVHPVEKIATDRVRPFRREISGRVLVTSARRQFSLIKCAPSVKSAPPAFFCIQRRGSRFLSIDACLDSGSNKQLQLRKAP
jgi:hypothetical protein